MKRMLAMTLVLAMALGLGAVPVLAAEDAAAPAADVTYSFEETVLVDNEDVKVTVTAFEINDRGRPTFELLFENKTDKDLRFYVDETYLNGRRCNLYGYGSGSGSVEVAAGQQAYGDLYWYEEDLPKNGINYVDDVMVWFWVSTATAAGETVYEGMASWSVNAVSDTPALTDLTFDSGFEEIPVLSGDYTVVIEGFDPDGPWDAGDASLVFYLENNTGKKVRFTAENVAIDGTMCDPYWGDSLSGGTSVYDHFYWPEDKLEEAHIERLGSVTFDLVVTDMESHDELVREPVTVDLTGLETAVGAPAEAPVEEPAEATAEEPAEEPVDAPAEEPAEATAEAPTEVPAEEKEGKFVRESLAEPLVTADPITLSTGGQSVTISLPSECVIYSEFSQSSNVEAVMTHVLGSGGGAMMAMTGFENPEGYDAVMHVHMENETDAAVGFDVVDVTVNGVAYDPIWEATLAPGASEDSDVEWTADFLILAASMTDDPNVKSMAAAIATIERFETMTMTVQATVSSTGEELFSETVTLDVTQNG